MNKTAIKSFAESARKKLMDAARQKANELVTTNNQIKQREKFIQKIKQNGFGQVVEEVAYTWFKRLITLRFMEVNGYLPIGIRVLSAIEEGKREPDVLGKVANVADELGLDLVMVDQFQAANDMEGLFRYILVKQCNRLGEMMPMVFGQVEDYTELLLPDHLLTEGSVVRDLVTMIEEDDWKEQVEMIGWLYQYYISEKKDQVFADLKKNKKIMKENIPAATQLFTPKWIVKYMVENSLGRLWLESHPDQELKQQWNYYLEEPEQEPQVQVQLEKLKNNELTPEDIKVFDPCMGSGHILVYAFDVFYSIYLHAGYSEYEIPKRILQDNLYGLDIDDRAAELAHFALLMKACSYDRHILQKKVELNLCSIQESNGISQDVIDYFTGDSLNKKEVQHLIDTFTEAKEYGSILEVKPIDFEAFEKRMDDIQKKKDATDTFPSQIRNSILERMPVLIKQSKILNQKYEIVVTNPPYMGSAKMNGKLLNYVTDRFKDSKRDLYTVFIDKCLSFSHKNGIVSMITQQSWMFASAYETFRERILLNCFLYSLLHLGPGTFEDISGERVNSTSFIMRNKNLQTYQPLFIDVTSYPTKRKEKEFFIKRNRYSKIKQSIFLAIPKKTICYWTNPYTLSLFNRSNKIPFLAGRSLQTGNDDLFVRFWYEVSFDSTAMYHRSKQSKWYPFHKGGPFRRWYGNHDYVLAWGDNGRNIRDLHERGVIAATLRNLNFFFKEGITYTYITSGSFSARYSPAGSTYSGAGPGVFCQKPYYLLGFLNSKVFMYVIRLLKGETERYETGDVESIPLISPVDTSVEKQVEFLVQESIRISKMDWDRFESSWDFKKHPLLMYKGTANTIQQAFRNWQVVANQNFDTLKDYEEQINYIFIGIYGLQAELTPEISDKDVSIRRAEKIRDTKSLISYAVGCMFGRYSLDRDGLIFAGGKFDESNYTTFRASVDNVIPITTDAYFEGDLVSRFIEFVRVTFGKETLEENLDFIADTLTKKANETSRQRIRRYFLKEFYKDHVQTYQNRPIYWLLDSGKFDGFKALIYMHRYDADTLAKVRTEYLHKLQRTYEAEIAVRDRIFESAVSTQEKMTAKKEKEKLQKQLLECQQYDLVIAYAANQKIQMNLDDGIKVNYAKFQNVEIPQGEGGISIQADLLAKI